MSHSVVIIIFICFWERYCYFFDNWKCLTRGNYNICLFLGEILLFLFMIIGNISHRGNYNICLFLGEIFLTITGNVSLKVHGRMDGRMDGRTDGQDDSYISPQTLFAGDIIISLPATDKYYNYHGVRHFQLS
jgi:hypothetical protein